MSYGTPEQTKDWRARHPGAAAIAAKKCREADPVKALYFSARARSGNFFELTLDYFRTLVDPMVCSRTGHVLSWDWDGPGANPWAPSVDRLDSARGYVPDNVQLVCWIYNQCKGQWPDDVVAQFRRGPDV